MNTPPYAPQQTAPVETHDVETHDVETHDSGASIADAPAADATAADAPITAWLHAWSRGEPDAVDALMTTVYRHLHTLAERALRGERRDHTLRATALMHEAFLRLVSGRTPDCRDRGHFFALVARMMRRILVDHARAEHAQRRGEGRERRVDFDEWAERVPGFDGDPLEMLALDRALDALARRDARKARAVEFRCFLGLSVAETAVLLDVSEPTVILDLRLARAWLADRLALDDPSRAH